MLSPKRWMSLLMPVLLWMASTAHAQYWKWSPRQEHHKAAVVIRANDGSGVRVTSGTIIQFNGLCGVLTCAHGLTGPQATVQLQNGKTVRARCTVDKNRFDLGFVFVPCQPDLPHLEVGTSQPGEGEQVEFVTFGGPQDKLRHWYATGSSKTLGWDRVFNTYVIHGDSGGGILNSRHQLIGVQSFGVNQVGRFSWNGPAQTEVYRGAGSPPLYAIRSFLRRVLQRFGGS